METNEFRDRNQYNREFLDALEAFLSDNRSGIPAHWEAIDQWEAKLTAIQRSLYYDSYHLYRSRLRDQPARFFHAAAAACLREPGLFWKQLGRGFCWDEEFSLDPEKTAFELIELFGCNWPPKPL